MKKNIQEEKAFSPSYLAGVHIGFYDDAKIFESISVALGNEPITMDNKNKLTDSMERRMRACEVCPIHVLAVWDEEVVL